VFGGFCLLFCHAPVFPFVGCDVVFLMPVFGVFLLGRIFSEWPFRFCLESLILAQDERWRRA
jgi:hypothetical protein